MTIRAATTLVTDPQELSFGFDAPPGGQWIHPSAHIEPDAQISGATVVGANSRVGASARLHDCILWEDTEIASDSKLESCIVTAGRRVEGTHANADF